METTDTFAGVKRCSGCKTEKPLDNFHRATRGSQGRQSFCKPCMSAKQATITNRAAKMKWSHLRLTFGVSLVWFLAQYEHQQSRCAICRRTSRRHLSVDHDHETGRIRGLLCITCNNLVGATGAQRVILQRAVDYLNG